MAMYLAWRGEETGGMLYDYKNGKWVVLQTWDSQEQLEAGMEIIQNMLNSGRDEIFVSAVLVAPSCGYLVMIDSNGRYKFRAFWKGIYDAREALDDASKWCRKVADEMGYRRPDDL